MTVHLTNCFSSSFIMASSSFPPPVEGLNFTKLTIPVTITKLHTIKPSKPIPPKPGDTLYLSNLDDMVGSRVFTPTVYFYHHSTNSQKPLAETLINSLSEILVPYYPFTARLRPTSNNKLQLFFSSSPNDGVLFAEAKSPISLSSLGDLSTPNPGWFPLIYHFPNEEPYKILDMPLLIAQLTHFACGGFSLGLRLCHCLCDGLGAMQFLNAWSSTAKTGHLVTSPTPCWDREIFTPRDPPVVTFPHHEFMSVDDTSTLTASLWKQKPVQKCYRISREFQEELKSLASQKGNSPSSCSKFEAMAAHIWRSWVKALEVKPHDFNLRLTFPVNTRHILLNPPLRDGFYGNAVCVACVRCTVGDLVSKPLGWVARMVQRAKSEVSEEYLRSTVDYLGSNDRPRMLNYGGKLTITQWTRFGIYESADFGWGRPVYAGPIDLTPTPQVCVLLPEGEGDIATGECSAGGGKIVVCICLPEFAIDRFRELFCRLDESIPDAIINH